MREDKANVVDRGVTFLEGLEEDKSKKATQL
jgi:hypothetical protein